MIPPRRFRDRTERAPEVEARLAQQLSVLAASPTVPRALRARAVPGRWGHPPALVVRWAIVAALFLVTAGGATGAVVYLVNVRGPAADDQRSAPPPPVRARGVRSTTTRAAPIAVSPPAEEFAPPTPVPEPVPVIAPPRRQPEPSRRLVHGATVAAEGELTEETRLIGQALSALREPGGGRTALQALDTYDVRFQKGALAMEAAAVRAEALLQVGDRKAALAILDRLPIGSGANVSRWMLLRGELRAAAGRCAEALVDFDRAWHGSTNADIRARAAAGRASCGVGTQ